MDWRKIVLKGDLMPAQLLLLFVLFLMPSPQWACFVFVNAVWFGYLLDKLAQESLDADE